MFPIQSNQPDDSKLYVDDVFSTYLYTGNGSTQTINNGIDLAGKGGLVWIKNRDGTAAFLDHTLWDSSRFGTSAQAFGRYLSSNTTAAESAGYPSGVNHPVATSTGFSISAGSFIAENSKSYVSWTFRKSPKFFDVVTYTGDGASNRQIPHSLGAAPGMVIIKRLDVATNWYVYSSAAAAGTMGMLNSTNGFSTSQAGFTYTDTFGTIPFSSSTFTVSNGGGHVNASNGLYVAYLFAHDPSADGIIQCGSYAGNTGNNVEVELGWEPQFLLVKGANSGDNWRMIDVMRGWSQTGESFLGANSSSQEFSNTNPLFKPKATGFTVTSASTMYNDTGYNFIYLAIRRPNKPPTSGTQVYNAIARTGTGAAATVTGVGFAPDLLIGEYRNVNFGSYIVDKLRGNTKYFQISSTSGENNDVVSVTSFDNDGYSVGSDGGDWGFNSNTRSLVTQCFRRAPGFFDVVCYTADGVNNRVVNHNLGVTPELVISKSRSVSGQWWTGFNFGTTSFDEVAINLTNAKSTYAYVGGNAMFSAKPTNSSLTLAVPGDINSITAGEMVLYLFATLPGISKVDSYTGNGSSQTINCGFSAGARFILIKRTDSTGDWYVWDSARGIVAANDPHLSLNTTAAEVTTDDSVDPDNSGFIVNQNTATNINVNGATYIFLAIS